MSATILDAFEYALTQGYAGTQAEFTALMSLALKYEKTTRKDLGRVTAYGYAKSKGYTGTEEQFAELMASYATVAEAASDSASEAEGYAEDSQEWSVESEAWATGQRNGADVDSEDETYHNNSKYYAEQAQDSADAAAESAATFTTDTGLTIAGKAADAKTTGDRLAGIAAAVGSPLVITDPNDFDNASHTRVYVYAGTTTSLYTNGDWYYWDGDVWESGGPYNSVAVYTDDTLSVQGQAADAAAVGKVVDDVSFLKSTLSEESGNIWRGNSYEYTQTGDDGLVVVIVPKAYPAGTYTLSGIITSNDTESSTSYLGIYKSTTTTASNCIYNTTVNRDVRFSVTFTVEDNPLVFIFGAASNVTLSSGKNITVKDIQLENGNTAHNFVDYYLTAYDRIARKTISQNKKYDIYPTGDNSDRSTEIMEILNNTKVCRFAPGDYYISVMVPYSGSTLIGCGNETRLIRLSDSTYNYFIRLRQDSIIKDLVLVGSTSDIEVTNNWDLNGYPAGICGIRIEGTGSDDSQRFRISVKNVKITSFAGSGIFVGKTGYHPEGGCYFEDVFVRNCNAGISFSTYAEFHRITGFRANECYYGCVNNGGNNVFANCDFSANIQALLMDNSSGDFPNSSHGSFVGCTFNHSDSNSGTAIELNTMVAGELFVGCSIFYGAIKLLSSQGVVFNGCNFGSQTPITITDGGGVQFANCVFRSGQSAVNDNRMAKTHFDNCYYLSGTPINGTPS